MGIYIAVTLCQDSITKITLYQLLTCYQTRELAQQHCDMIPKYDNRLNQPVTSAVRILFIRNTLDEYKIALEKKQMEKESEYSNSLTIGD